MIDDGGVEEVVVDETVVEGVVVVDDEGVEEVVLDEIAAELETMLEVGDVVVAYNVVCLSKHPYKIVSPPSKTNSHQ